MPFQKKQIRETVAFSLPQPRWSVCSHTENLNCAVQRLRALSSSSGVEYVLGYDFLRSLGTIERFHRLLPRHKAEEEQKERLYFRFFTLEDLLEEKQAYDSGAHIVRNGHFVGYAAHTADDRHQQVLNSSPHS